MDTTEGTAKLVDTTYKNIIDEFGPCTKQLVSAGRTYLKCLHAMMSASRQYTEALSKIASLANNSTLAGSRDVGSTLYNVVDVNKEVLGQQSNIIKSLEFDFLEPMEIAAEKDTKLVGREQKRFQQLYKARREAYLKCVSTLKKTRRKKNINTDKQLSHMKMLESAKERLEVFCNDSLKEAIIQERVLYGTVLERQCALNKQILIYHTKGCEILEEQLPHWQSIAETRDKLPDSCSLAVKNGGPPPLPLNLEGLYSLDSMLDAVIRSNSIARSYGNDRTSVLSHATLRPHHAEDNIYARPIVRAKSDYCLPTSTPTQSPKTDLKRFSRVVEFQGGECETSFAKALYAYSPTGDDQLALREGDVVEFVVGESVTGWQFGDNLASGKSGWFPVSYTEPMSDSSRYSYADDDYSDVKAPPPPLPPVSKGSVKSKLSNSQDSSEYATLTRGKKLLPVAPPTVATSFDMDTPIENGTLKAKHYASHPNIFEATASTLGRNNGKVYHNGQYLPTMRL